ncbi:S8 family serine peptidase [Sediminicola sp. 1XM1-17]|uniref:S8 family serine peptidase n=1 Tax=Sediminicola sp. 1XM1-17 TaxID=3127702 RepID=UPI003076B71E
MVKYILVIFFLCGMLGARAQEHAWVYFKDKDKVAESLAAPENILTARALARKEKFNVPVDERDVPVNQSYIDQIKLQAGILVKAKSKWLNCVHVIGSGNAIAALSNLDFVDRISYADRSLNAKNKRTALTKDQPDNHTHKFLSQEANFVYGQSQAQISQLKVEALHRLDYTGEGFWIAVMDGGFPNVDKLGVFSRLRANNDLKGGYDFVDRNTNIYRADGDSHGTRVLSDLGGYIDNQFVGTAPDASYILFRTEDGASETPVEESYWVEAAERADSLGVDLINTSLGYSTFDNPNYNYSPSEMDGNTTFISRGANIATEKGMLVVNSAGNSGSTTWGVITAPADANVFTVGAVDINGAYVSFSSRGPNANGIVKPDGMALGRNAAVVDENNAIVSNNGTSFSSPIMAGAIASFWGAFPDRSNLEIMQMVREGSSLFTDPNSQMGYGIPNFELALTLNGVDVAEEEEIVTEDDLDYILFPNPMDVSVQIQLPPGATSAILRLYDSYGKRILERQISETDNQISVEQLSRAMYIIQLEMDGINKEYKLIKK